MNEAIESMAIELLSDSAGFSSRSIWNVIKTDVISYVRDCTYGEFRFTKGDVAAAIGDSLCNKLGGAP